MSYPTPQFDNVTITSGGAIVGSDVLTIAGVTNLQTTLNGLLPLTGGTLTGALNGTTATFSGAIRASNFSGSSSGTNTGDQTIPVTSVFGRTGPITAEPDDYSGFYLDLSGGALTGQLSIDNGQTGSSVTAGTYWQVNNANQIGLYPSLTAGAFASPVESGDAGLIYGLAGNGAPTTGFALAPWNWRNGSNNAARFALDAGLTLSSSLVNSYGQLVLNRGPSTYNIIHRDDGTNYFIALSDSTGGTYNGLRPFNIALSSGAVSIDGTGAGTTFNDQGGAGYELTIGLGVNTASCIVFPAQSGATFTSEIRWVRNNQYGGAFAVYDASSSQNLMYVLDSGNLVLLGTGTGTDWVATSDRRIKEHIRPLSDAQALAVTSVEAKRYHNLRSDKDEAGFIAQDMQAADPTLVLEAPDGMLALSYDRIVAHHQRVIQLLMKQVATLEAKVEELENRL